MTDKPLTKQAKDFARLLADPKCPSIVDAYKQAGYSDKGDPENVKDKASRLAADPRVVAAVDEFKTEAFKIQEAIIEARRVLEEWVLIAFADAAELIEARRFCCRYCYGIDHRYQWVNEAEWADALAEVIDYNAQCVGRRPHKVLPEDDGGYGYERDREPVSTCPRCKGDGEMDVHIHSTKKLSKSARRLYAGVKQTQTGIEIKLRDQDAALNNLAKYLGMTPESINLRGPNGGPVLSATVAANVDPKEASKLYQAIMNGGT